jgi:hypothetical protein
VVVPVGERATALEAQKRSPPQASQRPAPWSRPSALTPIDLFFRLLGVAAALTKRLSQWRFAAFGVPLAPFHWLLMIGLAVAAFFCGRAANEGFINAGPPTVVPFKEVLDKKDLTNRYVSVSGMLVPEGRQIFATKRRGGGETVDAVYVPLVGEGSVLLVRYGQVPSKKDMHHAVITGMLRTPDSRLREKLPEIKDRVAPVTLDVTNVLHAEDRPPPPWPFAALAAACGLFCGMMLYTRATKWTVYRRRGSAGSALAAVAQASGEESPGLDLRVTGSFAEHGGSIEYFYDAPAQMVMTSTGELGFAAMVMADEAVVPYTVILKSGSLESWDEGVLYFGLRANPAVRLRFVDANTGRASRAFVKFVDQGQRRAFLLVLTSTQGYVPGVASKTG